MRKKPDAIIRLLAISDIGGELSCVRKLISQVERLTFDAFLVAGDIGPEKSDFTYSRCFKLLEAARKPIYFVLGNHDENVSYDASFTSRSVHLHARIVKIGDFFLTGFSGSHPRWGHNPLAASHGKKVSGTGERSRIIRDANVAQMAADLAKRNLDPGRCIVLSHDRCYKLHDFFGEHPPLANIHGHFGKASTTVHKSVHYLNVSKLCDIRPVVAKSRPSRKLFAHAGCFSMITLSKSSVSSEVVPLSIDWDKYSKSSDFEPAVPGWPDDWALSVTWGVPSTRKAWAPEERIFLDPRPEEA